MWNAKKLAVTVILTCVFTLSFCSAGTASNEPNAADLVRAVRESENWIHNIDSLYVRIESKWSTTPEAIAAEQAKASKPPSSTGRRRIRSSELKPASSGILEYAIDHKRKRVRHMTDTPGGWYQLMIWDGNELMIHGKSSRFDQESYSLDSTIRERTFHEFMAVDTSWPRSQPHSFWFDSKDTNELLSNYGHPQDFVFVGYSDYRGVDCYVLELDRSGIQGVVEGLSYRWYVGEKNRLLYGKLTLRYGETWIEHWMADYRQVAGDCWFPMTQGYELYDTDEQGKFYLRSLRGLKVLEVRINEKLPDELFKMELKEGIEVNDMRSGDLVTYLYKPEPPELVGKPLPELKDLKIEISSADAGDKMILVCFWDMEQRPSRNCIIRLAKQAEQLKQKGVTVVTVQASKIDENALNKWVNNYNIPFNVGMVQGDEEKTRFNWGVRSLPWLILTDPDHTVRAEGFGPSELNEKISAITQK